ncbi:MAG: YbaK/EbsC family protein [Actinomycetota bacterium]|nr:YbaK/EbsC family protein [Actinomycetota bacterium]
MEVALLSSVDVHNFLQNANIPHELSRMPEPTRTAARAAAVLGLQPHQVVKAVLFLADGKPVMALVPGNATVDYSKLKAELGARRLRLLNADEVRQLTGYLIGCTPPVALRSEMATYIDLQALREDVVYTGGGEPGMILKIRSYDLVRAADAEVADIIR